MEEKSYCKRLHIMCAMESFIKEMETAINNRKKMDLVIQLQRITHELWSSVITGNYK